MSKNKKILAMTALFVSSLSLGVGSAFGAAGNAMFGMSGVSENIKGANTTLDFAAQTMISNILIFLGILAVVYGIYAGFMIMNAAGDETKAKKGKQIIMYVVIGIIIIWLANSIIQFVLEKILK
ncbi:MAG: hypothetical protein PHF46_00680 [Candidatus Gracilibacteria bacterium]|nr:hypothetical protein [Candidatus Gracilibacteria bacterium]MDD3119911.1 hypothetical protein [Candidatus Gracilibacteria bacterium]MDD4530031.1 hypothetical protein [Candidatus Gracilibacteria bacterium]